VTEQARVKVGRTEIRFHILIIKGNSAKTGDQRNLSGKRAFWRYGHCAKEHESQGRLRLKKKDDLAAARTRPGYSGQSQSRTIGCSTPWTGWRANHKRECGGISGQDNEFVHRGVKRLKLERSPNGSSMRHGAPSKPLDGELRRRPAAPLHCHDLRPGAKKGHVAGVRGLSDFRLNRRLVSSVRLTKNGNSVSCSIIVPGCRVNATLGVRATIRSWASLQSGG